jgi:TPR repeat protein
MGERPSFIDVRARCGDSSSRLALLSPRLQYNDGEVPPSLSPLDAFAAQSRMLARQLDVEKAGERRISRLPPAMVSKSLSQHQADRPFVLRSFSEESGGRRMSDEDGPGSSPAIAHPKERHLSMYPRISSVTTPNGNDADEDEGFMTPMDRPGTSESKRQSPAQSNYFGLPRADSPVPTSALPDRNAALWPAKADSSSYMPIGASKELHRSRTDSSNSQAEPTFAISPPLRSVPQPESSDDDYTSSFTGSSFSYPRKLSASSGISAPHSPLSPFVPVHPPRSPSINSEASVNGISAPRPHLNFSRPRSTASLSIRSRSDSPAPAQAVTSQIRQISVPMQAPKQASAPTKVPGSVDNDGYLSGGGSSYTYARYSLPRGRMVSRDSTIFQGLSTPHFEWEEPLFQNTPLSEAGTETHSATSSAPKLTLDLQQDDSKAKADPFAFDFGSARPIAPEQPVPQWLVQEQPAQVQPSVSPSQSFKSARSKVSSKGRTSVETSDFGSIRAPAPPTVEAEDAKSTSSQSNSTLRPVTATTGATGYYYMSPDEHVTKGIECHENGSLQESTYHLRIAAMQNHSTAMLLYALACRHGWGMRANQREGVQWLRKALDSAMTEMTEDGDPSSVAGIRERHDKKARQAQFALSVYELGVSHLNGWGIEQDRALALRCFEVAGHWGDVDALSEAGFCYAEGIGCRKDLKKAARFYRLAEQRGVSMVGNSW